MSDISIILCSHNRVNALQKTLKSLSAVNFPNDYTIELLLIDNASDDNTYEVMQNFDIPGIQIRVLQAFPKGLSVARNRGVEASHGDIVLFTDDDVRFPKDWISGMTDPIVTGKADAVAGGVYLNSDILKSWLTVTHRSLLASTEELNRVNPERLVGANMAIAKSVFNTIPEFDSELGAGELGAGEETLFSLQMRQANFRITSAFETAVMHCPDSNRVSGEWFRRAAQTFGRSDAYISYHWKHRRHSSMPLYLGLIFYSVQLELKNRLHSGHDNSTDEMPLWEFKLLRKIHRLKMHFELRRSDFNYDLHGFTKKG